MGWETFNRLQTWLVSPRETSVPELGVIGSSFLFTIFLMIMKIRFLVVAPASGRLCARERDRDGWLMVSDFPQLVSKSNRPENWRSETLSASRAVLFRANLRGLHARMCLESHRIGAADADLHCLALKQNLLDTRYKFMLKFRKQRRI